MRRTGAVLTVGCFMVSALYVSLAAQASRSAAEGVYTAEQAVRGQKIYAEQCAFCHGDNLEGMGPMPPLAGADFLTNWQERTLAELFQKTHDTMPATAPGTLTLEEAADVTAYMLKVSQYPEGKAALASKVEALKPIKLGPPKK
jgi:mono/diheme cytochrome c family protein